MEILGRCCMAKQVNIHFRQQTQTQRVDSYQEMGNSVAHILHVLGIIGLISRFENIQFESRSGEQRHYYASSLTNCTLSNPLQELPCQ